MIIIIDHRNGRCRCSRYFAQQKPGRIGARKASSVGEAKDSTFRRRPIERQRDVSRTHHLHAEAIRAHGMGCRPHWAIRSTRSSRHSG